MGLGGGRSIDVWQQSGRRKAHGVLHQSNIKQVANRIVAVEDKKLVVYEGDYKCVFPSVP